ncbi:hypothetical protein K504DRAFT_456053 [Pleomassaria siparia CBS 279.74]|uniref:Uncharacterized protein n=1 Tax=Pleomassaria siparia CBS 279.74 TaxID=1314801 RepID=A0A6G1K525_9PLEO|nr:hypothetical protein K504DRAFT_456053 [Pleomassaria siparia CBS 279.74]
MLSNSLKGALAVIITLSLLSFRGLSLRLVQGLSLCIVIGLNLRITQNLSIPYFLFKTLYKIILIAFYTVFALTIILEEGGSNFSFKDIKNAPKSYRSLLSLEGVKDRGIYIMSCLGLERY